ncbi:universal stress protein [Pseudodesulfovibrio pelocollis]|uniref:universal stress protein n=1 Tax=Pseudodesulfovibrio pelocollis TaxID=3051432 RepID=UPI00255AB380|nr:universal stress protein [Pseudodesulfovibrio sp. SB368]
MHEENNGGPRPIMDPNPTPSGRESGRDDLDRHLLIALSTHSKAGAGVEFVSRFFTAREHVDLTLFHIPAAQAAVWAEETSYETVEAMETRAATGHGKGRKLVGDVKRALAAAGFDPERIHERVVAPRTSKGHDLIREAAQGRYDALVMGRRALMGLGEIMDKSLSRHLLEEMSHSISFPLWICRLPESDRRNVLLCVDGSPPSERITDHVGFMLAPEPGHTVTVFHVSSDGEDAPEARAVIDRSVALLTEAGMPRERIATVVRKGTSPARLIEDEYHAGRYAVVAIGSSGAGRGLWKRYFVGSVVRTVFDDLTGAALWVCF